MRYRNPISLLVFVGALFVTILATAGAWIFERQMAREAFDADVRELHQQIEARLGELIALLRGGAGLHATLTIAPDDVFATYVSRLDLRQNYPGVLGIGFARYVKEENLDDYIAQVRAEAFPDFTVRPLPLTHRDAFIIRMLQPLDERNQVAIGYDMGSEPARRWAMVNAAATGDPTVTGRVTLVQEITPDRQGGFLIYVPVYVKGDIPRTAAERWEQVLGLSYAPLRAKDFFEPLEGPGRPGFQVFTSPDLGPETLLYSTRAMQQGDWEQRELISGPTGWSVRYIETPTANLGPVWLAGLLGLSLSVALFLTTASAERRRRESMALQERDAAVARAVSWMAAAPSAALPMSQRLADWLVQEGPAEGVVIWQGERTVFERGTLTELRVKQDIGDLRIVVSLRDEEAKEGTQRVLERASWLIERASLHETVRSALAQSEEALRFANVLMGVLGHDLRNPLSTIRTGTHLLERLEPGPQAEEVLSRIRSSAERMTRLIAQILDFTRARIGGGIPIHPVPGDVAEVAREIVDELRTAHPDARIALGIHGDTRAPVDPDRFAQVLSNLLGNALEHGEGPEVRVDVDGTDARAVRLAIHNPGQIPPELLPTLFEPFHSRGHSRGGMGLGMYIARILVEGHGGQIAVASEPERGTTVRIVMPRDGRPGA